MTDDSIDQLALLALSEAWAAWQAGSAPIGAVVSSSDGWSVKGRNRVFDAGRTQVVRHAEIEALGQLPEEPHGHLELVTTLEPCAMCLGAIYVARVEKVRFLSADPYGGGTNIQPANQQMRRFNLVTDGPAVGIASALGGAFFISWVQSTEQWSSTLSTLVEGLPEAVDLASRLPDLPRMAAERVPLSEVLDLL